MGQLTNQYVSSSYQGLLKMTDSTQGLTNTLQTIQTGDGDNSPLQMSLTEVNISGSFYINNVPITNGTNGTSGTSGSNGSDGSSGTSGTNGSSGTSGSNGTNGSSGSSGSNGSSGSSGTSGSNGTNGSSGTSGSNGSSGTSGSNGTNGSSGTSGSNGTNGSSGTSGVAGTSGSNGTDGSSGSSGTSGSNGTNGSSGTSGDSLFALTGSVWNTTNNVGITGSLNISGSLGNTGSFTNVGDVYILNPASNNSSVKFNITGSNSVTGSNVIFGNTGSVTTQSGSVVISGSNNIILNGSRGSTVGTYGYIGGSNNIVTTIPTLSTSSLVSPIMNNNELNSSLSMTFRTSSLSVPNISNNLIYGTTTINHPSGSINVTNNLITANNVISNQNLTAGTVLPTLQNNIITGTQLVLNHFSSSILATANALFGTLTVNNSYNHTGSANSLTVANNLLNGLNITVNAGGSPQTNVSRAITGNLIGGQVITISAAATGSDLGGLRNTVVYGYNLNVTGSHTVATTTTQGAAFLGRWNSEADGLADSARTVFAVGTGTATGESRKTALYITSGSIVGVSGSLLVQGPSTLSGSVNVNGNSTLSGSLTITSGSGTNDLFMYGHKMFNVGVFYSTATQTSAAGVSSSVTYNTTDISQGVSVVAGSQLTLANAGIYNIQFSAQVLADTGSDDVWFWLKKNGTNIPDTAGRVTLANNEELMAAWNYVVSANAGDYIELVWQNSGGDAVLLYNAPTGNIPAVTSIITTVTQVR